METKNTEHTKKYLVWRINKWNSESFKDKVFDDLNELLNTETEEKVGNDLVDVVCLNSKTKKVGKIIRYYKNGEYPAANFHEWDKFIKWLKTNCE